MKHILSYVFCLCYCFIIAARVVAQEMVDEKQREEDYYALHNMLTDDDFNIQSRLCLYYPENKSPNTMKFKFGKLSFRLDNPNDLLTSLMTTEFMAHHGYDNNLQTKLTYMDVDAYQIVLNFGKYETSKKHAIVNGFGYDTLVLKHCILCADIESATYGTDSGVLCIHAHCFAKCLLPDTKAEIFFNIIYRELPLHLMQSSKTFKTNVVQIRCWIIMEILGKLFDIRTKGKYVSARQHLFCPPKYQTKNETKFDWNIIRVVQKDVINWNLLTTEWGMLFVCCLQ